MSLSRATGGAFMNTNCLQFQLLASAFGLAPRLQSQTQLLGTWFCPIGLFFFFLRE